MPKGNPIDKDLKQKILNSINLDGLSVAKASQEYGITTKTIYNWLNKSIVENSSEKASYAELSRLRKDKEDLLLIIGELTKELKDSKKKSKNMKWLCKIFKIARGSAYYKKRQRIKDLKLKTKVSLENILNTYYGHRRIAISLKINKKTASRIINKFEIYCKTRKRKFSKPLDRNLPHMGVKNNKKEFELTQLNQVWSQDFTHLSYRGILFYLATVIDEYSKEVVGFSIGLNHEKSLILNSLKMAVFKKKAVPKYAHSDQGSEYRSYEYFEALDRYKISASMSKKSSPRENGAQESFYGKFKFELGNLNRFDSFEKAVEAVILQIHYYNNYRIHTKLKMSPVQFTNLIQKNS